jgi:hypothetical protein
LERAAVPELNHHLLLACRFPYLLRECPVNSALPGVPIDGIPHALSGLAVLGEHVPVIPDPFVRLDSDVVQEYLIFAASAVPL